MAEVMKVLDAAGVNIEYSYAFSFHRGEKAVLVFRFSNNLKALDVLSKAGFVTLNENEVAESIS
jgi:hypothetical protein